MQTRNQFTWPQRLEPFRVPDALSENAYNAAPPRFKAAIKTALALGFFHFRSETDEYRCIKSKNAGFGADISTFPAPWTFLLFQEGCGAAHMTSAALLPVLANVPQIAAGYIGQADEAFLLSMTLCGIEDIYQFPETSALSCSQQLIISLAPGGRLFYIHGPNSACDNLLVSGNAVLSATYESEAIILPSAASDIDTISFCLGRKPETGQNPEKAEVIYTGKTLTHIPEDYPASVRLILNKGCEGFWIFPHLTPKNFTNSRLIFNMAEDIKSIF